MGSTNIYDPKAYGYFQNPLNVAAITQAATDLGISRTAVAAFIAKKNNNYETGNFLDNFPDRVLDGLVKFRSLISVPQARPHWQH